MPYLRVPLQALTTGDTMAGGAAGRIREVAVVGAQCYDVPPLPLPPTNLGFRVWGFRDKGLGFRVSGLGIRFQLQAAGSGFNAWEAIVCFLRLCTWQSPN